MNLLLHPKKITLLTVSAAMSLLAVGDIDKLMADQSLMVKANSAKELNTISQIAAQRGYNFLCNEISQRGQWLVEIVKDGPHQYGGGGGYGGPVCE